jgi:hypothetical protein
MDDQKRDGRYYAAVPDETEAYVDKAADDELPDDEMADATGGTRLFIKKTDEDAPADGRVGLP